MSNEAKSPAPEIDFRIPPDDGSQARRPLKRKLSLRVQNVQVCRLEKGIGRPAPGNDWILIKVRAFGLNRSELMTRKGLPPNVLFPRILGIECVGEVEFDPSGEYLKGQKVAALMGGMGRDFDGSYAEFTVVPKHIIHAFHSALPWEVLGAIPEMFQTAHGSLHLALGPDA